MAGILVLLPALVLVGAPLTVLVAALSLSSSAQLYAALAAAAKTRAGGVAWKYVQPYVLQLVRHLERSLGTPESFAQKLQPTHALLLAVVIVLLVCLERIRAEIAANARR
eukprot:jgi/Chlat1/7965/Chrsp69S07397